VHIGSGGGRKVAGRSTRTPHGSRRSDSLPGLSPSMGSMGSMGSMAVTGPVRLTIEAPPIQLFSHVVFDYALRCAYTPLPHMSITITTSPTNIHACCCPASLLARLLLSAPTPIPCSKSPRARLPTHTAHQQKQPPLSSALHTSRPAGNDPANHRSRPIHRLNPTTFTHDLSPGARPFPDPNPNPTRPIRDVIDNRTSQTPPPETALQYTNNTPLHLCLAFEGGCLTYTLSGLSHDTHTNVDFARLITSELLDLRSMEPAISRQST